MSPLVPSPYGSFPPGGLSFLACGFAFAFGTGNVFIGYTHFFILDLEPANFAFFFFQVPRRHQIVLYISITVHICRHLRHHSQRLYRRALQLQRLHHLLQHPHRRRLPHLDPLGLVRGGLAGRHVGLNTDEVAANIPLSGSFTTLPGPV